MLLVLKRECGDDFTQKIEGMIQDISKSEIIMQEYAAHLGTKDKDNEIKVLTQGNWPVQSRVQVNIPQDLKEPFGNFEKYYKMKHQGKALRWSPYFSFCTLEGTFDCSKPKQRTILLEVSLIQAAVLLLFNEQLAYTFQQIMTELDVEEETLEGVLVSLASMKYKVLSKSNATSRSISRDESFSVNDGFKSKLKKISIPATTKKQSQQESEETHVRVQEDRKYLLEAIIVQQMKKHGQLEHTALVNEIFMNVKFPLTHDTIKGRIESLIGRDYMEVSDSNSSMYLYIA